MYIVRWYLCNIKVVFKLWFVIFFIIVEKSSIFFYFGVGICFIFYFEKVIRRNLF